MLRTCAANRGDWMACHDGLDVGTLDGLASGQRANQVGKFFEAQDKDTAPAKIAEHITKFWDPRMRRAIVAHLDAGRSGLGPTARQAVEMLRTGWS
jgi:formate dehydrogenase subunit delta